MQPPPTSTTLSVRRSYAQCPEELCSVSGGVTNQCPMFGNTYHFEEKAINLPNSEGDKIVSEEYYNKIRNSSRIKAVAESFYLLSSGREYQWYNTDAKPYEEFFTVFLKVGLLATTGYYYVAAKQANSEINSSFMGFGSDQAIAKFHNRYNNFKIAGGITASLFGITAIHSYIRFGTDSDYKDLHITSSSLKQDQFQKLSSITLGVSYVF
ncbi:MAG: hypothetical protein H7A23_20870 [Leptospiraceae bacterium]|nr:hypothetical protein [Leptospiraceae bacterium]